MTKRPTLTISQNLPREAVENLVAHIDVEVTSDTLLLRHGSTLVHPRAGEVVDMLGERFNGSLSGPLPVVE